MPKSVSLVVLFDQPPLAQSSPVLFPPLVFLSRYFPFGGFGGKSKGEGTSLDQATFSLSLGKLGHQRYFPHGNFRGQLHSKVGGLF